MKLDRTAIIALASVLGMLALILLQVRWLQQSTELIGEQFNQKVSKAMSMAVSNLRQESDTSRCVQRADGCFVLSVEREEDLREELATAMAFYDLPPIFEFQIVDKHNSPMDNSSPFCCSLRFLDEKLEDQMMMISFPEKPKYIASEMGLMMAFSILLLLLLLGLFIYINLTLRRQKRVTERNTDFFNNMAHEFKTPLTNISLASNRLLKKDKANPFLAVIQKESERLKWQVERVLHLAKMEQVDYTIERTEILLLPLVNQVLSSMYARLESTQAQVDVNIPEDLTIYADAFHLSNSLHNLLDNAIKYCEQQPYVTITAAETEAEITLSVEDNGVGISKSNQAFVFEKFQRVGSGDLHINKGFGLGLAYVNQVIQLHKGYIDIRSEVQKGSRFELHLPKG
ncbi:MAG: HAMP domain-containing sensor histidine kinase [Bacteroidota bacterium]